MLNQEGEDDMTKYTRAAMNKRTVEIGSLVKISRRRASVSVFASSNLIQLFVTARHSLDPSGDVCTYTVHIFTATRDSSVHIIDLMNIRNH